MIEAIECAYYSGKIICAFPTRDECKNHIKENYPNMDPFDVQIKTQYVSDYKPSNGYFDR
jgi:hypothetical protein